MTGNAWDLPAYPGFAYTEDGTPLDAPVFPATSERGLTVVDAPNAVPEEDTTPPEQVQALVREFTENMLARNEPWSDTLLVAGVFAEAGPAAKVSVSDLVARVFVVVPTEDGFAWLPTPVPGSVDLDTVVAAFNTVRLADDLPPNVLLVHVEADAEGHTSKVSFDVRPDLTTRQVRSAVFAQEYAEQVARHYA